MEHSLYGWLFTYNTYTKKWNAFMSEDKEAYFNESSECKSLISSKTIDTLLYMIISTDGKPENFEELVNE
ncbi:hypothetical protein EB001_05325 [bacterium]|nr:hypothetical protein [bacterium]